MSWYYNKHTSRLGQNPKQVTPVLYDRYIGGRKYAKKRINKKAGKQVI